MCFICLLAVAGGAILGDMPETVADSMDEDPVHIHSAECWARVLICEDSAHEHGDACYAEALVCGYADAGDPEPTQTPDAQMTEAPEEPEEAPTAEPTQQPTEMPEAGAAEQPAETPAAEPEAIALSIAARQRYAFAGQDELIFDTLLGGGAEPVSVEYEIYANGQTVYTHSGYEAQISYMPREFGAHTLTMTATDANGKQASTQCTVPVAADEREQSADWEGALAGVELTGDFARDILAVAQTQRGYAESTRNFEIDAEGVQRGYTRYGDWFGSAYGAWNVLFVSFCAHYARIPESVLARADDCGAWAKSALYRRAESGYVPAAGDLIFFYDDAAGDYSAPRYAAIVSECDGSSLYAIGEKDGAVQSVSCALNDRAIAGYISMAEITERVHPQPTAEPTAEPEITQKPEIVPETIDVRVEPDAFTLGEIVTIAAITEADALFQWQRSLDGVWWEDIEGANEISYSLTADEENTQYYYRVLKIAPAGQAMLSAMNALEDERDEESVVIGVGQTAFPLNASLYEANKKGDSGSSTGTTDTPKAAPDYVGTVNTANAWQIVEGQYQGNAQSQKIGYDGDGDGFNDLYIQKNVIPTGVENEFRVYLSMDRQMTWDELLAESTLGLTTQGKWKESDVGRLVSPSDIGGNKSNQLQPGLGSRNYKATIHLTRGGREVHTFTGWYNGTTPNASNCTGYIILKGLTNQAIIASISVNLHEDGKGSGGTLEYTIDLDKMASNNIHYLIDPLNFDAVTDVMGENMIFQKVESADGDCSYDAAARTLTWNPVPNAEVEGTNQTNPVTGYHHNVCQLVYTVRLDVTTDGFHSCAGNMSSRVGDPESYRVNERAVLEYHFGENGAHKQQEYPVPYVRGLLYDVALKKIGVTDGQSGETALAGAEFTLYEADGTTPVQRDGQAYILKSGADGSIRFTDLPWGDYVLRETQEPEGYEQRGESAWDIRLCYTTDSGSLTRDSAPYAANMRYSGRGSGGVWKITNTKKPPFALTLTKMSDRGAAALSGAAFELTDSNGAKQTLTTDADGQATLQGLEMDVEYVLTEKTPPEGHFAWPEGAQVRFKVGRTESGYGITEWTIEGFDDDQQDFAAAGFEANALRLTMTAKDERANELRLEKRDGSEHSKALDGAMFALFSDAECTVRQLYYDAPMLTADHATTADIAVGRNGATLYGLRAGTYYLKETAAPAGYCLINTALMIELDEAGNVSSAEPVSRVETANAADRHTAIIYDYPIRQLPATGGAGNGLFYVLGLALIAAAAYGRRRLKRNT